MKKKTNIFSKIRLVYRPGKTLTKVALLGVIVLSTVSLVTIHNAIQRAEDRTAAGTDQAFGLEQKIEDREHDIDILGSQESIEDIAREEAGMGYPGEIIYNSNNQ